MHQIQRAMYSGGGHWAGANNGNDWLENDFVSAQFITGVYIERASTDITTNGFRLVLKLKKPNGEWVIIEELYDANINRTALSGGAVGQSIPSYSKKLSPAIKATAFRLEFYGNGWFDATDIGIETMSGLNDEASIPDIEVDKWITPTDSDCRSNGGKLDKGICLATWYDAKAICDASGGHLPTIDELKRVIIDCGGEVDDFDKNNKNLNYQACYKSKGFSFSSNYWTSSFVSLGKDMWSVPRDNGNIHYYVPHFIEFYVRCVRDEQTDK